MIFTKKYVSKTAVSYDNIFTFNVENHVRKFVAIDQRLQICTDQRLFR